MPFDHYNSKQGTSTHNPSLMVSLNILHLQGFVNKIRIPFVLFVYSTQTQACVLVKVYRDALISVFKRELSAWA